MLLTIGAIVFLFIIGLYLLFILLSFKFNNDHRLGGDSESNNNGSRTSIYLKPKNKEILEKIISKPVKTIKYYDEITESIPYTKEDGTIRHVIHVGQLKLQLTEIEFLTECLQNNIDHALMVYAGSAPSNHMSQVSLLFPNVKFLLVDPNEHRIMFYEQGKNSDHFNSHQNEVIYFKYKLSKEANKINFYNFDSEETEIVSKNKSTKKNLTNEDYKKISEYLRNSKYKYHIIEDLFTNDLAEALHGLKFYFCSDIRTCIGENSTENSPSDEDILFNSAQMFYWIKKMDPIKCMLKFRTPFFSDIQNTNKGQVDKDIFNLSKDLGIDFLEDYKKKIFHYFKPESIYIQAFPGQISSESRLITSDYETIVEIDPIEYDDKFYYYNRFFRLYGFHKSNEEYIDSQIGIDYCADCALMILIYQEYYKKYFPDIKSLLVEKIKQNVSDSLKSLHRNLNGHLHGKFLKPYNSVEEIVDQQEEYRKFVISKNYKY